ncbi:hypothetical protein ABZP36_013217 [Zizania latifolia]
MQSNSSSCGGYTFKTNRLIPSFLADICSTQTKTPDHSNLILFCPSFGQARTKMKRTKTCLVVDIHILSTMKFLLSPMRHPESVWILGNSYWSGRYELIHVEFLCFKQAYLR